MIWGLFAVTSVIWLAAIFFLIKGWSGSGAGVLLEEFTVDAVNNVTAQPDIATAGPTPIPETHEETIREDEIEIHAEEIGSEEEIEISIPEPVREEVKPIQEIKPIQEVKPLTSDASEIEVKPIQEVKPLTSDASEIADFSREFCKANMVEFPSEYVDSESIRSLSGDKIHIIEFAKNCYREIGCKCLDTLMTKIINGKTYIVSVFDLLSNHYSYTEDEFISYFGQTRDSLEHDINSINAHPEMSENNRKALAGRYEGLPQLLVWNKRELFLILVKSKDDKLTEKEVVFLKEFISEKKLLKTKIFRVTEKKLIMPQPDSHPKEHRLIQDQFDKAAKPFQSEEKPIEIKQEPEKIKPLDIQSAPEEIKPIKITPEKSVAGAPETAEAKDRKKEVKEDKPVSKELRLLMDAVQRAEGVDEEKKIRRTPFEKDEILFLKENKDKMTNEELAAQLGRSLDSVTHKLSRLNLARESYSWTPEKNEFLRTNLASLTYKDLAEKLGTTIPSVRARCKKLGINK